MKAKLSSLIALTCVALASGAAHAQSAGDFIVRLGGGTIMPDVKSGNLSAPSLENTRIDVKKASQVVGGITYMVTDNFSIDLPLSPAFKHEVVGDGAIAGVGTLATVKALPATLIGQYRLGGAKDAVRPYVGLGVVYAKFFDSKGTTALNATTGGTPSNPTVMNMENRTGSLAQLGVSIKVWGQWSLDMAVDKTFLKTTGHLTTGQSINTTLDPTTVLAAVGYSF
ncbi:MAG: OmpW family protein [Paucibacter sp.]|nr:OmpW family protein [Roseateles sp.]